MKSSLWFTAISLFLGAPLAVAKSELETLRERCSEQEIQIRQLAEENAKLRTGGQEAATPAPEAPKVAVVAEPVAAPPEAGALYVVLPGDSFAKIARKMGSTAQKIADASGLKIDSMLHLGQKLTIPSSVPPAVVPEKEVLESADNSHIVQIGETFTSIAKKHGCSSAALMAANPMVQATSIQLGQVIRLPESPAEVAKNVKDASLPVEAVPVLAPPVVPAPQAPPAEPVPTAQEEPKPASKSEPAAPGAMKKNYAVVVEHDMTLGDFAASHQTTAERLNEMNGFDLAGTTILAKGSQIIVDLKR